MKVLIFSSPFLGHYGVLKRYMALNPQIEFKLVFTTWENLQVEGGVNLYKRALTSSSPITWTFPRVRDLFPKALEMTKSFNPEIILYDFFSLEGFFVSQALGIPACSSIASFLGPNAKSDFEAELLGNKPSMEAIGEFENRFDFAFEDLEYIADGLHLPAQHNLVWGHSEIASNDFLKGRSKKPYEFVGNLTSKIESERNGLYISFGSVVMGNLWEKESRIKSLVTKLIEALAENFQEEKVLFVTQGRKVLDTYPKNWLVKDFVDQNKALSEARVFLSHGGNNSLQEAFVQQTPMLVLPFFGDQKEVAKCVEENEIGFRIIKENYLETEVNLLDLKNELVLKTRELMNCSFKQVFKFSKSFHQNVVCPDLIQLTN